MQSTLVEWGLPVNKLEIVQLLVQQGYVYIVHGIFKHRGPSADIQVNASEVLLVLGPSTRDATTTGLVWYQLPTYDCR